MTRELGPDERALTPEEIALEDAENNPAPLTPFEKAQMRGYQEPGDLAVFAYERDHPQEA